MLLLNFLDHNQAKLIREAVGAGIPIIIDGDRSKPTGKTTLCDYLKGVGAVAYEAWELEEGEVQPNDNTDANSVSVTIRLNKALFT